MFEAFESCFKPDPYPPLSTDGQFIEHPMEPLLAPFFSQYGGISFNNGLYRVMSPVTQTQAHHFVALAFSMYSQRIACFGYDWLGRIFALDSARQEDGAPGVVMFEPGFGEVLEVPCNLQSFHKRELIEYRNEALSEDGHGKWLESGGEAPKQNQCIGYKKPLFLGGKDTFDNLELSDLDVYWTIFGQLIDQIRGLPPGTPIGKISISD